MRRVRKEIGVGGTSKVARHAKAIRTSILGRTCSSSILLMHLRVYHIAFSDTS